MAKKKLKKDKVKKTKAKEKTPDAKNKLKNIFKATKKKIKKRVLSTGDSFSTKDFAGQVIQGKVYDIVTGSNKYGDYFILRLEALDGTTFGLFANSVISTAIQSGMIKKGRSYEFDFTEEVEGSKGTYINVLIAEIDTGEGFADDDFSLSNDDEDEDEDEEDEDEEDEDDEDEDEDEDDEDEEDEDEEDEDDDEDEEDEDDDEDEEPINLRTSRKKTATRKKTTTKTTKKKTTKRKKAKSPWE